MSIFLFPAKNIISIHLPCSHIPPGTLGNSCYLTLQVEDGAQEMFHVTLSNRAWKLCSGLNSCGKLWLFLQGNWNVTVL